MQKLSDDFYKQCYPMMTKHKDSATSAILIVTDIFKMLPISFKTRNEESVNDLLYKYYTYDKLIVLKMTENRLQDSDNFKKTCRRFDGLHADASSYHSKVALLRQNIMTMKESTKVTKQKVIGKFNKKMKV